MISYIKRKIQDIGHGGEVIAGLESCFLGIFLWVSPSVVALLYSVYTLTNDELDLENIILCISTLFPCVHALKNLLTLNKANHTSQKDAA